MSAGSLRLFVAVDLDPEVRARLGQGLLELSPLWPAAKWVPPANLHLTAGFIGDWERRRLPDLEAALALAVAPLGRSKLLLAGTGFFGPAGSPRVVWAGVREGAEALAGLAAAVDRALAPLGVGPPERPYRAHLTLARGRGDPMPPALRARLEQLRNHEWGWVAVDQLWLVQSELGPGGPRYTKLSSCRLGQDQVVPPSAGCYTQIGETGSR